MKYHILFIPIWIINCSQLEKNNSEVFITYSGHSDLERPEPAKAQKVEEKREKNEKKPEAAEVTEGQGVVFIPNDKPVFRVGDEMRVDDLMNNRRIDDLMRDVKLATENPHQDTLFISGKNNDNVEKHENRRQNTEGGGKGANPKKSTKITQPKLDCTHLNCNNTVNSVCGGREIQKKWKYRLFLNECFFRKVNCGFQHAANRYVIMSNEKCKNIGAHYVSRPFVFKPIPIIEESKVVQNKTRRSFSSRRSLNIGVDGSFCGHPCPATCTDDYDPQCAVSKSGTRKVFLNHCKLDYNSCVYKVVWHRRPLSECVGGRKADMNQNRGFIGWMQRVGIVDGKGRLVLT